MIRMKYFGTGILLLLLVVTSSIVVSPAAHASGVNDAQAFANSFCPTASPKEDGIADYMWITNPADGSTTFNVTNAQNSVPVNINFYVTYCKVWPSGYTNGATQLQVVDQSSGADRLASHPGSVGYADRSWATYGSRWEWGPTVSSGTLDISGWDTGDHAVCTSFRTTTNRPGAFFFVSTSACFNIHIQRTYPWDTGGISQVGVDHVPNVSSWPAQPGQAVTWNHGIWNTTQYGTDQITAAVERSGFSAASGLNGNQYPYWPGAQFTLGPWANYWFGNNTANYNDDRYFTYQITQDDVGAGFNGKPAICQYASWGPWWSGYKWGDVWKATSPACVQVPYNFNLTPTVNAPTDTIEPGAPIAPIDPAVNNKGPTKSYDGTQWQLSKFILPSGAPKPGTADVNSDPCTYYKNNCANIGSGNQTFSVGDTTVGSVSNYVADDVAAGSRICFALSVTGYDAGHQPNSGWWRHGVPTCIVVGKKPKVQVWGGDVAARGSINVSQTQKTNGVFGSWVEYGAFSVGANSRFASGAGLNPTPAPQTSNAASDWSKLTFANTPPPEYGHYSGSASDFRALPNIAQYFSAMAAKGTFFKDKPGAPENTFATGSAVQVMTAGDLTLSSDKIPKGRSAVIVASGTVTITGDITYDDTQPLSSPRDLPQLVIIANKININQNVANVDAWLVTSDTKAGVIDTCGDVNAPLSDKVCDTKLTIHGPVVAGELHLKRTGGSGTGADSGEPAELINLRPDAFLWAQLVASGAGKAETVNTTELPPRF